MCSRAALPHVFSSGGTIIHIASALAFVGFRNECAHGPTKAGIERFTKGMALDDAGLVAG
ncbi:SDR family NAD(P)-dependent oxidoreductase [Chelativorans intermedius]|uniref:SDR family NAD(P)-dependent oxidoreductase n=1 Tax=Chelativorans intermedius TaxID=515947 RepID=A0ABV6D9R9_9HYPH